MWDTIKAKKQQLDNLRPLSQKSLKNLDDWYDVELTYTSNAIEGNTLTRMETAVIIEKGITIAGKQLKEHLEITDHYAALQYIREIAGETTPLSESDVRKLHQMVLAGSWKEEAGRYSRYPRRIKGSQVTFPNPVKIPELMEEFGAWLGGQHNTPQAAFEAHYQLVSIHPFSDGNGRTARLLMNLILLRAGYPPVSIGPEERVQYLQALEERQLHNKGENYEALMLQRLDNSLDQYIETAQKEVEARNGGLEPDL